MEILLPANESVCALPLLAQVWSLLARVALPARVGFATIALLASTAFGGAALRLTSWLDKRSQYLKLEVIIFSPVPQPR